MNRAYRPRIKPGTVYRRGTDYIVIEDVDPWTHGHDTPRGPGDYVVCYVGTYAAVEDREGPTYPQHTAACYEELRNWWHTLSGQAGCYRKVKPDAVPARWREFFRRHSDAYRAAHPDDIPAPE